MSAVATKLKDKFDQLSDRVEQILRYHLIDCSRAMGGVVAHFSTLEACEGMLLTAIKDRKAGITLWAGDANCLNDPLEGRALVKYVEDTLKLPFPRRAIPPPPVPLVGSPHSVSHPALPRSVADLPKASWEVLGKIVHGLYEPLPPSATGWSEPRLLPSSEVYLVSFCSETDGLDLWRPYGDDGKGACMVMPLESATKLVANTEWGFYKVMYADEYLRRAWILLETPLNRVWVEVCKSPSPNDQAVLRNKVLDTISPVLHLYKHGQFASENEIRLVFRGTKPSADTQEIRGKRRPVLYTDPFFLKGRGCKIVLGPKTPDRNRQIASLKVLLRKLFKRNTPEVQISGVPYQ